LPDSWQLLWNFLVPMLLPTLLILCAICAVATLVLALIAKPICEQLQLMDRPGDRKLHRHNTPLLGGLTLCLAIMPVSVVATFLSSESGLQAAMLLSMVSTLAMALLGMADDRHSLAARDRILLSILVFGSITIIDPLFLIRFLTFQSPHYELGMGIGAIGWAFTILCCVGLVNAVNMADGKNGLVIGLCLGWLALLALRAPPALLPLVLILCTALLVLLVFNLGGHLFLGDGGSYGFATATALLSIAIYNSSGTRYGRAMTADELILLFAVPVIDSFRLTFVRLRRGVSPMTADRDHLHHHLQDRFGWPAGLIAYQLVALIPATLGFLEIAPASIMIMIVGLTYGIAIRTAAPRRPRAL